MSARGRAARDSGAAAVEFALLLPVFAMLTIGMISGGFAFERWIGVTQGAHEAARFAATLSVAAGGGTDDAWLRQVADRAVAASGLTVDATHAVVGTSLCVALVSPTNYPAVNKHLDVSTDSSGLLGYSAGSGPCANAAIVTGDYVQVQVSRPTDFNYVVTSSTIQVSGAGVSRFEAASSAPGTP